MVRTQKIHLQKNFNRRHGMNKNFSEWYRTANIDPTDEILQSRWQGIEKYCKNDIGAYCVLELVRLFFKQPVEEGFREDFINAFCEVDSAFSKKKNATELSVLAGATLVYHIENFDDLAMLALMAASFNKRKACVPDLLTEVKNIFVNKTSEIREIKEKMTNIQFGVPSNKKLLESLKNAKEENTWKPIEMSDIFFSYFTALKKVLDEIKIITNNNMSQQKVYREDSQILWWMTGEWSRDLQKPFNQLKIPEACIVSGKELADLVGVLPGPYAAKAVLHKALSVFPEDNVKDITLSTAINQLDKVWRQQVANIYTAEKTKEITPLLAGISESLKVEKGSEWKPAYKKLTGFDSDNIKMPALELAYQMYLECLVVKSIVNNEG